MSDNSLRRDSCQAGRPGVFFSPFDLTGAVAGIDSYRALGYKPASARKIVGNILAYVMAD